MNQIAFIFSGQGAQYPGMMKDLRDGIIECKELFAQADAALGRDISGLCFTGPQEALNLTHNTQPCVLAADLAAYFAAMSRGIMPDVVAGFSLGEYAALVAAGVIQITDAFTIVQARADAMQNAVAVGLGAMAAVMNCEPWKLREFCTNAEGYVDLANFNRPGQIVISGEIGAVDSVLALCKREKIRTVKLPVSAPFHSRLMEPALPRLQAAMEKALFKVAKIPVYLNVDAQPETESEAIKEKLMRQAVSPVYWEQTIRNMHDAGVRTFIECGPGEVLTGFVSRILDNVDAYAINSMESLEATLCALGRT